METAPSPSQRAAGCAPCKAKRHPQSCALEAAHRSATLPHAALDLLFRNVHRRLIFLKRKASAYLRGRCCAALAIPVDDDRLLGRREGGRRRILSVRALTTKAEWLLKSRRRCWPCPAVCSIHLGRRRALSALAFFSGGDELRRDHGRALMMSSSSSNNGDEHLVIPVALELRSKNLLRRCWTK